jgi:ATP-binding cassette subfamily F protein uup
LSKPLLFLKEGELSFGGKPLFTNISLQISRGEKICLVGKNGSGKSTLMNVLAGLVELDKGEFYVQPSVQIGYLPQTPTFKEDATIYDYVMENLGSKEELPSLRYQADIILAALQLEGLLLMRNLSGGKVRRASLAKALIANPAILLLDEPTNHLDIEAIEWLETYLQDYSGALICISHDRAFLKNVSNKTWWLRKSEMKSNNAGFVSFEEWSNTIISQETSILEKMDKKLAEENLWLQQGVTARRKRNQGRLHKLFELRSKLQNDRAEHLKSSSTVKIPGIASQAAAKMVVEMEEVSHYYTDVTPPKQTLHNFSTRIIKGEKIGLVGPNGAGKTTLIKLLIGQLKPSSGKIKLGANLTISYFDQKRESLKPDATLWETLCPGGGDTVMVGGTTKHVVTYLKDFLFDAKQAHTPVSALSGGEANRLLLAKILTNPGNFLILDEPTNDLDTDTLDILQEMLSDYQGTLLLVSHDRDFLDRLVTRTFVVSKDHHVTDYIGGYSDYLALRKNIVKPKQLETKPKKEATIQSKNVNRKMSYKDQRDLELLPEQITNLEGQIKSLEEVIADPNFYTRDPQAFNQKVATLENMKQELATAEQKWLELAEQKDSFI